MAECCIKFAEPVSRETISQLVIEYLKYILYYRGQFPLPLDQLINSISNPTREARAVKVDDYSIYVDTPDQRSQSFGTVSKPGSIKDRTKQKYEDTINKFDVFFKQLLDILINKDVIQVIMNLGPNMMSPKELHCIMIPAYCSNSQCTENTMPFQKYRLQFFKSIMHSVLWEDFKSESLFPISILLQLKKGAPITEHMEQKRFYVTPKKCTRVTVRFDDFACSHVCTGKVTDSQLITDTISSGLWVKLKTDLKGIKPYFDSKKST